MFGARGSLLGSIMRCMPVACRLCRCVIPLVIFGDLGREGGVYCSWVWDGWGTVFGILVGIQDL